jgi:hypothetical protein
MIKKKVFFEPKKTLKNHFNNPFRALLATFYDFRRILSIFSLNKALDERVGGSIFFGRTPPKF